MIALLGYERVIDVDYDPSKNPTRMAMQYPTVGVDMRPLPPKRTEVCTCIGSGIPFPSRRSVMQTFTVEKHSFRNTASL